MTTEELARRFAELCGWKVEVYAGRIVGAGPPDVRADEGIRITGGPWWNWSAFTGWPGVGIVVDEMARRGRLGRIEQTYELLWQAKFRTATGGGISVAMSASTPIDAVLAAALAALEAEAKVSA